jgi:hypothetical protein
MAQVLNEKTGVLTDTHAPIKRRGQARRLTTRTIIYLVSLVILIIQFFPLI